MGCTNSKDDFGTNGNETNGDTEKSGQRRTSMGSVCLDGSNLEKRIDAIKEVRKCEMGEAKVRYAYVTQRGYYPDDLEKANQDAYAIEKIGNGNDYFLGVFDGHGRQGDYCAQFAKRFVPENLTKYIEKELKGSQRNKDFTRSSLTFMTKELVQRCLHKAHVRCNFDMHKTSVIDDSLSGTTAISVFFHGPGNRITISNVGDSRAVIGKLNEKNGSYRALPLSRDHTPYRPDERERVIKAGARVLSLDQLEGVEPVTGNWDKDINLGEEIDESGDPPRVWAPNAEYPGTAFTRSIGDAVAEELGVYAEPEMITKELTEEDKIIVIASDGVFEFLTNQSVIDICAKFQDPLEACKAIVAESYELWLQYELRTDDITIICVFIDELLEVEKLPQLQPERSFKKSLLKTISIRAKSSENLAGHDVLDGDNKLVENGIRPVREGVNRRGVNAIKKDAANMSDEASLPDIDISQYIVEKGRDEKERIRECLKGNRTFQNISIVQMEAVYDVVEKVVVKKGTWVIKQGTVGENYYIIDHGKFQVRILKDESTPKSIDKPDDGGKIVHVYEGGDNHPSFGEIALVHSMPRAASVIAQTDGVLWALSRPHFTKIMKGRSDRRGLRRTMMRKVDSFKSLESSEIQDLSNNAEEIIFEPGDVIIKKGDIGDTFYVIVHGRCTREEIDTEIKENDFFGEEVLLQNKKPYQNTVVAATTTKC